MDEQTPAIDARTERELRSFLASWREQHRPTNEQQTELFERLVEELTR